MSEFSDLSQKGKFIDVPAGCWSTVNRKEIFIQLDELDGLDKITHDE